MPVIISSREQDCNSDVHVNDKVSRRATRKTFPRTKSENKKVKSQSSEVDLFRIRKKHCRKNFSPTDKSSVSCKILKEKNRDSKVQQEPARPSDSFGTDLIEDKDVALKFSVTKRKIYEHSAEDQELSSDKCKLQKLLNTDGVMYDYRASGVPKGEGDVGYLTKSDAAEENLINAFYQQQCLGGSNNSIATLCNIGNSCYLNSVIYTLRFAPHFLHKLHHLVDDMRQVYQRIGQHKLKSSSLGRNVSGIQNHNGRSFSSKDLVLLNGTSSNGVDPLAKSNQQIATEKLHELYTSLHRNESIDSIESFHAGTFLQSIQDVSSVFEGNQQQDAHELLMCILDSIRETCSTLIKTIKENPEIMNQNVQPPETNELTSPPHTSVHSAQSLKSIFSRKIRRKDTLKSNGGTSSPIKENVAEHPTVEEEPTVDPNANKLSAEAQAAENNEKVNEAIKRLGLDFFCKDFEGITLFTTKCLTCETVTEQKETMVDIAIPISHDNLTQPIDPQLFFQVRILL